MFRKLVTLIVVLVAGTFSVHAAQTEIRSEAAFQVFEGGYMLWEGATGNIWVLYLDNTTRVFSEASYASLPDNPIFGTPDNRVRPISGFGRVWGNYSEVRDRLGWALGTEQAYTLTRENLARVGNGAIMFRVTLPDGRAVMLRDDSTWFFVAGAVIPTLTPISPPAETPPDEPVQRIAYQPFEGGFMVYDDEQGDIWAFYDDGTADFFASTTYGGLVPGIGRVRAPRGYYRPILGFGKVWGSYPAVRERLGWATAPEEAIWSNVQSSGPDGGVFRMTFTIPNGQRIELSTGRGTYWRVIE